MEPTTHQSKAEKRRERRRMRAEKQQRTFPPLKARTPAQTRYIAALSEFDQVMGIGAAGSGKTYIAARLALRGVIAGDFDKVVVCRPTVSADRHRQGFLPGNLQAKLQPWLIPILDGFAAEASGATIEKLRQDGKIEFLSFEHMRGRSIPNACVLLDEAQNCTLGDLKMFLTRIGEDSQVVVCGDPTQVDIHDSGLSRILEMVDECGIEAEVIEFGPEDVVRSAIAREWVAAFEQSR